MNSKPEELSHELSSNTNSLLFTKLFIPQHPANFVSRDRLMLQMSRTHQYKLTLITAPPGFGKTTMVSDWVRNRNIHAAWVSLDHGENDLLRFWGYVIAALDRLHKGTGKKSLSLLQSPVAFSIEQMVVWLVNDLLYVSGDIVLILDDYHVVESEEVHRSLFYFLERLPSSIHLCIISRKEPSFPIGTLRAKGQLHHIGIAELKFTEKEIESIWFEQTGVQLNKMALRLLAHRTEGWAAGVQLAVLSQLSGHQDSLQHFSGNHRFVVDYLMEEVFLNHPEPVRNFLIRSSILERMNKEVCAAVTECPVEEGMLQGIERAGLFLIPLDGERYWYRYHHLFMEFLRSRLQQEFKAEIAALHLRASDWFERNGFIEEAIEHSLAVKDYERVASLLEIIAISLLRRRELTTLFGWLRQLPEPILQRPGVLIILVWTELFMGHYERVGAYIESLKTALAATDKSEEAMLVRMWEEVVIVENFHALLQGNYKLAYALIEKLHQRDDLPDGEGLLLSIGIELNEGTVPFTRGYYGFNGRMKQADRYHRVYDAFIRKNDLYRFAFSAYQQAALSEICLERNDLEEALQHAESAIGTARKLGVLGAYIPAIIVKSRVQWANGDMEAALNTVREASNYLTDSDNCDTLWFGLFQAYLIRCNLTGRNTELVDRRLEESKLSLDKGNLIHREFEWITMIHVLMAKDHLDEALAKSEQLLASAKESGRIMTELEACICLSLLYERLNRTYDSMLQLHQALHLGEREGYLRIFADTAGLVSLLKQYADIRRNGYMPELQSGVSREYVKTVLAVAGEQLEGPAHERAADTPIDALTPREMEVLQLIEGGLTNKEIAEQLFVTEGTVKLHLHRIYGKLQVKGRVQAIQKAIQWKLIPFRDCGE